MNAIFWHCIIRIIASKLNFSVFQFSFLAVILLELILCLRTTFYLFAISYFFYVDKLSQKTWICFTAAGLGKSFCKDLELVKFKVSNTCGCNRENLWPVRKKKIRQIVGKKCLNVEIRRRSSFAFGSVCMCVNVGIQRSPNCRSGQQVFSVSPFPSYLSFCNVQ